jgi:hypothetical protein
MKIRLASNLLMEVPNAKAEKTRFKTIEDFKTKKAFDKYIADYIKLFAFKKLTIEEKIPLTDFKKRSAKNTTGVEFSIPYNYRDYEVKLFTNGKSVITFSVPGTEYNLISRYIIDSLNKTLTKAPLDIFLALCGLSYITITAPRYSWQKHIAVNKNLLTIYSSENQYVIKAWVLGLDNFREFGFPDSYKDSFQDKLKKFAQGTKININLLNKNYENVYKLEETWNLGLV